MMKNLYLFIIFLCFAKSFSQQVLQNSNWVFGDNLLLNFNAVGIQNQAVLPPSIVSDEGIASVSDLDGNLLFWTDGTRVFGLNGGNVVVYNSPVLLFGNGSSFQNVVITPRPNNPGRYYIFYISGYTSVAPGQITGLYCAEVDTVNQVILNPNTPLLDLNGTPIDDNYGNQCEALTTAPATNGDYWLITHVQNNNLSQIYSYRIAENTITNAFQLQFNNNVNNPSLAIKISPNLDRIALSRDGVKPILGQFNAANGNITNLNLIGNNIGINDYYNGLEFSPNGNNLFFMKANEVRVVALNAINQEFLIDDTIQSVGAIQRALDGNLYIARKGVNFLSFIGDPNIPTLNQQTLANDLGYIGNFNIAATCWTGLPQWVWQNCNQTLTTGISPLNAMIQEERQDWISSTDFITFGDGIVGNGVVYHAGNFVDLLPGFEARTTSQFGAYIQGCTIPQSFVYKQSSVNNNSDSTSLVSNEGGLKIYPNPTNDNIEITLNNFTFNKVSIFSIDGKNILDRNIEITDKFTLDVSKFAQGVYIINVISNNGKTFSQKLIKN